MYLEAAVLQCCAEFVKVSENELRAELLPVLCPRCVVNDERKAL
jgi:hypothetical protein